MASQLLDALNASVDEVAQLNSLKASVGLHGASWSQIAQYTPAPPADALHKIGQAELGGKLARNATILLRTLGARTFAVRTSYLHRKHLNPSFTGSSVDRSLLPLMKTNRFSADGQALSGSRPDLSVPRSGVELLTYPTDPDRAARYHCDILRKDGVPVVPGGAELTAMRVTGWLDLDKGHTGKATNPLTVLTGDQIKAGVFLRSKFDVSRMAPGTEVAVFFEKGMVGSYARMSQGSAVPKTVAVKLYIFVGKKEHIDKVKNEIFAYHPWNTDGGIDDADVSGLDMLVGVSPSDIKAGSNRSIVVWNPGFAKDSDQAKSYNFREIAL